MQKVLPAEKELLFLKRVLVPNPKKLLMKTIFTLTISANLLLMFSCTRENAQIAISASSQSSELSQHYIGEPFGGGIIFYVDSTGSHGLIAAPADLEEPALWSYKDTLIGVTATHLGSGVRNTLRTFAALGDPHDETLDYGALVCHEFILNGYTDWFLPSKNELNKLYQQRNIVGDFKPFAYWSSTEIDQSTAWFQNFSNGVQIKSEKMAAYAIRPIRYF
jgi:Protein of unknown function (DUF1566)